MRKVPQPSCPVCDSSGIEAYPELRDRLFGAPGSWRMARCTNGACRIHWLDPAPLRDDLPVAYRGYYTHSPHEEQQRPDGFRTRVREAYLARRLGYPVRQRFMIRAVSRLVPLMAERKQSWLYTTFFLPWVEGGRLLEIGCGSGWQLSRMQQAGWITKGLDFDPEAAATARRHGLDVDVGDVRDLRLDADSFDAIVMAHVLEHVFDPIGLLDECRRLLKPGGRLVAITPNSRSLGHRIYGSAWRGLEPPRHIAVFTTGGLRIACDRAGLEVESVLVTARDAANLLLASARTRDAVDDAQIEKPRFGKKPPVSLRLLASIERLGNAMGRGWGEELVLTARKRSA